LHKASLLFLLLFHTGSEVWKVNAAKAVSFIFYNIQLAKANCNEIYFQNTTNPFIIAVSFS